MTPNSLPGSSLDWIGQVAGSPVRECLKVQSLWGQYGALCRVQLLDQRRLVVKIVEPPKLGVGLEDCVSDQRKRRSYQVEQCFYQHYAAGSTARLADLVGTDRRGDRLILLLEDLRQSGFAPWSGLQLDCLTSALRWLAQFHASFLRVSAPHLWEQGSYWHLATRLTEWQQMAPGPFREHAHQLDELLRSARFTTLVHGDAKPANFLWDTQNQAAAVDFQYVGRGPGIVDVAYFLDCCLDEAGVAQHGQQWLDIYFEALAQAIPDQKLAQQVCQEWRALFPVAWCDFQRFWLGWAPSRARVGAYSHRLLKQALT